ncbi:Alpha/beta hydrolase fold protein, partial [Gonapodya prolifera JEL478]
SGPPLLLLHGNPQTHYMWHSVAPEFAKHFTVIASDLRGYGESSCPPATPNNVHYSKKRMAEDQALLMEHLGYRRFLVVSHDRGARTAHRLCIDYPDRVIKVAFLDIVPTLHMFETMTMREAMGYHHWLFLAQPYDFPEKLILAGQNGLLCKKFPTSTGGTSLHPDFPALPPFFHPDAVADYTATFCREGNVRGMCEDYRAGARIDLDHDRESRAKGERVKCDVLVLWGNKARVGQWYNPVDVWKTYCDPSVNVTGYGVDAGHYIAEENPEQTLKYV